jgi:hypothetical protein
VPSITFETYKKQVYSVLGLIELLQRLKTHYIPVHHFVRKHWTRGKVCAVAPLKKNHTAFRYNKHASLYADRTQKI